MADAAPAQPMLEDVTSAPSSPTGERTKRRSIRVEGAGERGRSVPLTPRLPLSVTASPDVLPGGNRAIMETAQGDLGETSG